MIKKFKHKGLDDLWNKNIKKGVPGKHLKRIQRMLTALNAVTKPQDMALPGYRLHELKGKNTGVWAIRVSGNWRITFKFSGSDTVDIDLVDYH